MITHTVLFRLKRPSSDENRRLLIDGLTQFATAPPFATGPAEVKDSLMLRGEGPRAADVLLTVTFPDADAFPDYLSSEIHQRLVTETLEPLCDGWWSVQFES
jgi:Stress responsive A/B Barrel Domain